MDLLEELETTIRRVTETVGPSVVGIRSDRTRGSGLVLAEGQVLTNAHNVWGGEAEVTFAGGRTAAGRIAGATLDEDVAVLTVDSGDAPPLAWAGHAPQAGSVVFALADPGGRGLRTTFGVVSATSQAFRGPRRRRITGSLEHTAPLARGSSGGPVVDRHGQLVAISTHRLAEGFYLALPADAGLRGRVDALGRGEQPSRRRLGVGLAPDGVAPRLRRSVGLDERDGLLVRAVDEEGPAARAGIRSGDLIVAAGEVATTSADTLHEVLDGLGDHDSLRLTIVRGSEELEVTVTFA